MYYVIIRKNLFQISHKDQLKAGDHVTSELLSEHDAILLKVQQERYVGMLQHLSNDAEKETK